MMDIYVLNYVWDEMKMIWVGLLIVYGDSHDELKLYIFVSYYVLLTLNHLLSLEVIFQYRKTASGKLLLLFWRQMVFYL
jgi:hypothetical protein